VGHFQTGWRSMKALVFVIDYLIVHELIHLLETNHTLRFWNIVSVQVPRCEQAKTWLREHSDLLEVDFQPVSRRIEEAGHLHPGR
jgi:predicted metal-dependent hydrolase